jgi:hypothetical protein
MTTAADDSAFEDAFEALLAGRPVPEGAAGLAAFTGAVRASATAPGRPDAALAELLATGLLTHQSSPSVRTARSAGTSPAGRPSRVRIRRRSAMILPVLFAKFLSAGAVAQAATGAGVVLVAVSGVGAVGALPAPVQDTFSSVVAAVTPLEAPGSEEVADGTAAEETLPETMPTVPEVDFTTAEDADVAEGHEFDVEAWIEAGPEGYGSFGAWVSESVRNPDIKAALRARGKNFGSVVSQWAHKHGLDRAELAAEGVDLDELDGTPTEPVADVVVEDVPETKKPESAATTEDRGSRGNEKATDKGAGHGDGGGHGNGSGPDDDNGGGHGVGNSHGNGNGRN